MIKFSHVTKTYRTNVGLEDVSVDIEKGDFVFLVGPSGAGKSTFIKLILKEIDADEGSILVDDREVTQLSNREIPELRRMIGTVFQDFRLLPKKDSIRKCGLCHGGAPQEQETDKKASSPDIESGRDNG